MKLDWMNGYRDLIDCSIRSMNAYAHYYTTRSSFGTDASFSLSEIQVVEYILENEELNLPMVDVANRLGLSTSNFSRIVKRLVNDGFLERYYLNGNRKSIIIKVSDYGRKTYEQYASFVYDTVFKKLFSLYDAIPKEYWPTMLEIYKCGTFTPPTLENKVENILERIE